MAKKKKKSISLLKEVDKQLDHTYDDLITEIEDMQYKLMIADKKAQKKARKMKKKDKTGKYDYSYDKIRIETRKQIVSDMESKNFLDRVKNFLDNITPIIVSISRMVAALIVCILQIDVVKVWIKPETLDKMKKVYEVAMAIS